MADDRPDFRDILGARREALYAAQRQHPRHTHLAVVLGTAKEIEQYLLGTPANAETDDSAAPGDRSGYPADCV